MGVSLWLTDNVWSGRSTTAERTTTVGPARRPTGGRGASLTGPHATTRALSWPDSAERKRMAARTSYREKEPLVQATGITANLSVPNIGQARDFYVDYLGLSVEGFNMGWVARFQSPDGRAVVQLVTRDATAPHDSVISVHVGDGVEEAYEDAIRRGFEIVHPLTTEPWGIRRFFVRAPDGNVININSHKDD